MVFNVISASAPGLGLIQIKTTPFLRRGTVSSPCTLVLNRPLAEDVVSPFMPCMDKRRQRRQHRIARPYLRHASARRPGADSLARKRPTNLRRSRSRIMSTVEPAAVSSPQPALARCYPNGGQEARKVEHEASRQRTAADPPRSRQL